MKVHAWTKSEEDKLKVYLDQKMSIKAIKVLMNIRYKAVERKIKVKGWKV